MDKIQVSVKKEIKTKKGIVINVDEKVTCTPFESYVSVETQDGRICKIPYTMAYKYLTKFTKEPSIKTLEKRVCDGVDRTPINNIVELDGKDSFGFPSWTNIIIGGI